MRAVTVSAYGGPEVFEVTEVAEPIAGAGQVLIKVAVSGINFLDARARVGRLSGDLPYVAGVECAGTVAAVGAGVDGFTVGQRVCAVNVAGAHAEYAVAEASRVLAIPAELGLDTACAALVQGLTGHYLTHDTYPVQPGDTVLVHAAAGGRARWSPSSPRRAAGG
ncbi:alcohol dehydrogenase catalytic domain-containing protein [Micromonospora zhanjiangensis]